MDYLKVSVVGCTLSLSLFIFYGTWIENASTVNKSQALSKM